MHCWLWSQWIKVLGKMGGNFVALFHISWGLGMDIIIDHYIFIQQLM